MCNVGVRAVQSCRQRVAVAHERGQLLPAASEQRGWKQRRVEIIASSQGHDEDVRVRRMQEDALRWVHENRPTPAEAGEEAGKDADEEAGAEAGEDADEEAEEAGEDAGEEADVETYRRPALVFMIVDGSDEEAGAVDPRNFPAP